MDGWIKKVKRLPFLAHAFRAVYRRCGMLLVRDTLQLEMRFECVNAADLQPPLIHRSNVKQMLILKVLTGFFQNMRSEREIETEIFLIDRKITLRYRKTENSTGCSMCRSSASPPKISMPPHRLKTSALSRSSEVARTTVKEKRLTTTV